MNVVCSSLTRDYRHDRGFTIIEVVVVMAVLSILALLTMPVAELSVKRIKERELKAALWEIRDALDRYKVAYDAGRLVQTPGRSGYPRTLDELTSDFTDIRTGEPMHFIRRLPNDPFASADQPFSWGLRSYASPASRPESGDDVYDVYSLAPGIGLNGVPYAKW